MKQLVLETGSLNIAVSEKWRKRTQYSFKQLKSEININNCP